MLKTVVRLATSSRQSPSGTERAILSKLPLRALGPSGIDHGSRRTLSSSASFRVLEAGWQCVAHWQWRVRSWHVISSPVKPASCYTITVKGTSTNSVVHQPRHQRRPPEIWEFALTGRTGHDHCCLLDIWRETWRCRRSALHVRFYRQNVFPSCSPRHDPVVSPRPRRFSG